MESVLPWIPGAVQARLLADVPFTTAIGGRLYTRSPSKVTLPYATLQLPAPLAAMGGGGYKPLVQVDAWRVAEGDDDPEVVVWRIAMLAKNVLDRARNVPYQTLHWSARVIDCGPLPADKSRGESAPLYRAMVRAELTVHNV